MCSTSLHLGIKDDESEEEDEGRKPEIEIERDDAAVFSQLSCALGKGKGYLVGKSSKGSHKTWDGWSGFQMPIRFSSSQAPTHVSSSSASDNYIQKLEHVAREASAGCQFDPVQQKISVGSSSTVPELLGDVARSWESGWG